MSEEKYLKGLDESLRFDAKAIGLFNFLTIRQNANGGQFGGHNIRKIR
ncbi:MAG: hypothetical protein P8L68_13865 [Paracoccaceae bacterium]|nr:hypothetical protein [Paracoccaceae bacterium]